MRRDRAFRRSVVMRCGQATHARSPSRNTSRNTLTPSTHRPRRRHVAGADVSLRFHDIGTSRSAGSPAILPDLQERFRRSLPDLHSNRKWGARRGAVSANPGQRISAAGAKRHSAHRLEPAGPPDRPTARLLDCSTARPLDCSTARPPDHSITRSPPAERSTPPEPNQHSCIAIHDGLARVATIAARIVACENLTNHLEPPAEHQR